MRSKRSDVNSGQNFAEVGTPTQLTLDSVASSLKALQRYRWQKVMVLVSIINLNGQSSKYLTCEIYAEVNISVE